MGQEWLREYYDDVDNMRLDAYLARHTDDVTVVFGNNPPAVGKDQVGQAIGGFWELIDGMRHNFVNVYEDDGATILQAEIDYERKDGQTVRVPATSILQREGDLVNDLRIYIDLTPVFA
jgi:ketosteroid isomerase-like protein